MTEPSLETKAGKEPILRVEELSIGFVSGTKTIAVTDHINFELFPGEIYGLVGESGCGKTVTALSILRLLPVPAGKILQGRILYKNYDILSLPQTEMQKLRGSVISMIFQEPGSALNPLMPIEKQLRELFDYHDFSGDPLKKIMDLLERVGIADASRILRAHPHELSGGMQQRIIITMALLLGPDIIIADEPTTALDVTVQAQIMELLLEMQQESGTAIILITHNMGLIAQYANRVAVMYAGQIVEEGLVEAFLEKPLHPYSQGLMAAIPDIDREETKLTAIPGQVPAPADFPTGCRFRERCPKRHEKCLLQPDFKKSGEKQKVACFLY